jgi:hypothetical protein
MGSAPSAFTIDSPRVRIQRLGAPREIFLGMARVAATLAVAVGLTALASMVPHGEGLFVGMAVLTVFGFALALLAFLPLGIIFVWTGLGALLARPNAGVVTVGDRVVIERGRDVSSFATSDIVAVDAIEPGWATLQSEDGDLVHIEVRDARHAADLAAAIATTTRALWVTPLYSSEAPKPWPRHVAALVTAVAGFVALVLGHGPAVLGSLVGCVGLILWLTILRPGPARRCIRVGADGVAVEGDVGWVFLPFTSIERVDPTPLGAALSLASSERVTLAVVPPSRRGSPEWELGLLRRAGLLSRLAAGLTGAQAIAGEERLARQGRTFDEWRAAVRDLVRLDAPGYRTALVPPEQAARIVERGNAAPEARVGAALALAVTGDAGLKWRVRVALEAVADDSTRSAIAEALDDRLEPWRLPLLERSRF